jgi:hypothetical protein
MQSDIIAYIVGGNNRVVKVGESITLDGSQSYDDDYGTDVGFAYSWKCVQISPSYNQNCPVKFNITNSSVISVNGLLSKMDSVAYITLTVTDNSRYAETSVYVTTKSNAFPLVTIATAVSSKINPSNKVKLKGFAVMETSGIVEWSLYDSITSLNRVSLVQVTHSVTASSPGSEMPFYLCVASNTLSGRTTYTLQLASTLQTGESSSTSIDVTANGPPLPGFFDVTPQEGEMLSTNFTFLSTHWEDEDLPVYFAFGYVSYDGSVNIVQRRSQNALCVSQLPSGKESESYNLTVITQVYDSLGANNSMSFSVHVKEVQFSIYELQQYFTNVIQFGTLDSRIAAISTANTILSQNNCSGAPDCNARHRSDCVSTPNTCGKCIDGYMGIEGDSNSFCASEALVVSGSNNISCADNSSVCSDDFLMECVYGKCVAVSQLCIADCHGRGECLYRSQYFFFQDFFPWFWKSQYFLKIR